MMQRDPALANLNDKGQNMLGKALSAAIAAKLITNPLSAERRTLVNESETHKRAFVAWCGHQNIVLALDSMQDPEVFNVLSDLAIEMSKERVIAGKKALIQEYRPGINLQGKSVQEIETLHAECAREKESVTKLTGKLTALIEGAKLPAAERAQYAFTITRTNNPQKPYQISITNNFMMGYSIWELLCGAEILQRNPAYNCQQSFDLSEQDMQKLDTMITELFKYKEDFTQIMADLLVDNADTYVTTAQKKYQEILDKPLNMSPAAVARLRQLPGNGSCLLLNQVSLLLANHPKRDFIKKNLCTFYRLEGMVAANGRPKEFLDHDPYRTNINVLQMKQICPRLNRMLKFQQSVRQFVGTPYLEDGLNLMRSQGFFEGPFNELVVMKDYNAGILFEIYQGLIGQFPPAAIQGGIDRSLANSLGSDDQAIDRLETVSKNECEKLLKTNTGVHFKAPQAMFEPTRQQVMAMYRGAPTKTYSRNGQSHTHKNMDALFNALLTAPTMAAILTVRPEYRNNLNELKRVFIDRLEQYPRLSNDNSHYSKGTVDRAIGYFEQYVASIYYADLSHITQQSVENSLLACFANDWNEVLGRCATGLDGRVHNLVQQLRFNVGSDFENHIVQFQKDRLGDAFQQYINSMQYFGETSMYTRYRTEAEVFLGLTQPQAGQPNLQSTPFSSLEGYTKNILKYYFNGWTTPDGTKHLGYGPESIYHSARKYFGDLFWAINRERCATENAELGGGGEEADARIYDLLSHLGFPGNKAEIDKKYRVNGNPEKGWQYAYFQQDLARYLIPYLLRQGYLVKKQGASNDVVFTRRNEALTAVPLPEVGVQRPSNPQQAPAPQTNNNNNNNNNRRQDDDRAFGMHVQADSGHIDNTGG